MQRELERAKAPPSLGVTIGGDLAPQVGAEKADDRNEAEAPPPPPHLQVSQSGQAEQEPGTGLAAVLLTPSASRHPETVFRGWLERPSSVS